MQRYTVYFIWKTLYMFRVVTPPNIRIANNCIYGIWYLLLLPAAIVEELVLSERAQHTQTSPNFSTIAAGSSNKYQMP
jgi:hypothetical protein